MDMPRMIPLFVFLLALQPHIYGQWLSDGEVISALGLHANRPKIKVSTTFGEAIIFGRTEGPVNALQGFQRDRSAIMTQVFHVPSVEIQARVYPNPCQHEFRIDSAPPFHDLKCYSLDGRLMAHWPIAEERYHISHLPKGIYLLRARIEDQEITIQTLIIQ